MSTNEGTRTHPVTGEVLRRGSRRMTLRYKDEAETVELPGWYADDDAEGLSGILEPSDGDVSDAALARMKTRHESRKGRK